MKKDSIRKKFNDAVKQLSSTPEGQNTDRILGALKSSVEALRSEDVERRERAAIAILRYAKR